MARVVGGLVGGKAVIGVDLGTTNSCAWVSVGGRQRCVVAPDGSHLFPSCVHYRRDHSIIVGSAAKRLIGNRNQSIVINTKRIIGRPFNSDEVQSVKDNCGSMVEEKNGKPVFYIKSQDRYVTPVEVSTEILKAIIEEAKKQTDCEIGRICVTIPANFDENQRSATLQAVLECGFSEDQVRLLNEPTAAAICYGQTNDVDGKILLVFDFGGGTFDVSIVKGMGEGDHAHYEVCMYKGNNHLGGADIDAILLDWMVDRYREVTGNELIPALMDEGAKASFRRKLLALVERAKIDLSTFESSSIEIASILPSTRGDIDDQEIVLTRTKMNDLIRDKVSETLPTIKEALDAARLTKHDIDAVILVGGSSRLAIVNEIVENFFGRVKISDSITKDECVATGACLALVKNYDPDEIIAYSLGQYVNGNEIQCVIPVNSKLPARESETTYTSCDNMTEAQTAVYQGKQMNKGDTTLATNGSKLAPFSFTGFQRRPAGQVEFKTIFEYDKQGLLYVTVLESTRNDRVLLNRKRIEW